MDNVNPTLSDLSKMSREEILTLIADMKDAAREDNQKVDLESVVTSIMVEIGIPAHIKGYHYLRKAIIFAIEDPKMITGITKWLYPAIAKEFETTSSRVERAIRHAIECAWDRGDVDILSKYFGYTILNSRGKPTNGEFIAMIADHMRLRLKSEGKI